MNAKQIIYKLSKYPRRLLIEIISCLEIVLWIAKNKPFPFPHRLKVNILNKYATKFHIKTLVETGTYLGQTVDDLKDKFNNIYSIELDKKLCQNAKNVFKKDKNVEIIHGDSATRLIKVIKTLKAPTLFWLDAHYSGGLTAKGNMETPILKELITISKSKIKDYVILIDDARKFTGTNDYPTIKMVRDLVKKYFFSFKMIVKEDIIRIYPYENKFLEK